MDDDVRTAKTGQPMLALFLDVYVARLSHAVTTTEVAGAMARLGLQCSTNELYDALERNPYVRRACGRWEPHHRRQPDPHRTVTVAARA